jgi:hypothetical protein
VATTKPAKPAARQAAKAPSAKASPRAKSRSAGTSAIEGSVSSADAKRLAAEIEQGLARGRTDVLAPEALQALMAAAIKAYAAQVEAGQGVAALGARTSVTPTEVMIAASGLLRAANLAVFELGMWQSWTGR